MWNYLLRRLLLGMLTLGFATFLVYGLVRSMPGDPLLVQQEQMDPRLRLRSEDRKKMMEIYGLDKSWPEGYVHWLTGLLRFDLGNSLSRHEPVTAVIGERIGPTLLLSGTSLVLGYLLAIPLGLYATARGGKLDERSLSVGLYMLYSLPAFVAALFLQMIFAVKLQGTWLELPLDGMKSRDFADLSTLGQAWDLFRHALLPVVCMTYGMLAYDARFIRANMQEVMRQDFIRTARAKGVSQANVIVRHAFRNTLIPLVTMIGLSLPLLLSGAIILEQIFTWPGMGRFFFESIRERDYPTIMGLVLLFSTLTLVGQLLADILYAVVDPRVTYSQQSIPWPLSPNILLVIPEAPIAPKSRGFWSEAWRRFRRRKLAMTALAFVVFLSLVAILAPVIVGTKPLVCKYKGEIYFPALGYFNSDWENPALRRDMRLIYPKNLKEKDPESWAIWPLVYQDPFRRVRDNEWLDRPGNPSGAVGSPSRVNLFGATATGYDVFAIMVHGTRTALLVGFVSMGIAAAIGITLGSLAGYFRGPVDTVISRLIEVVLCVPTLVLILALVSLLERPKIWHTMAIIGCTQWTSIARLARGEFLKLRESEFVMSARALGVTPLRIIFRHILPNALAPVLVPITFGIAGAILIESGLSYLGFGPPPPNPSWGDLLSQGRANMQMWWLILFPGLAIFLTVLAYNLIGEGLQESTDPRLREAGK